jgi:hypothetical protein
MIIFLFCHVRTQGKFTIYEAGSGPSPEPGHDGSLILTPEL